MKTSPARRCSLALGSCALAFVLLRPYIADALRSRGDEFLRSGQPRVAQDYYQRAIFADMNSARTVADYVFAALEIRTPESLREGACVADAFLQRHPQDIAVRLDRALVLLAAHDARAVAELREVGKRLGDARLLRLAAIEEHRRRSGLYD